MTPPAGVKVTVPEVGPETWVLPVGSRGHAVLVRFWRPQPESRKRSGPMVTWQGPTCEQDCTVDELERAAAVLSAAAAELRAREADEVRARTEQTLFDLGATDAA